ncbi:MAG TPA: hypothetical protein VMY35_10955 [Phycisphaerae bacterium]|nr:hypothetical protein [Phycisphaerae bacterium]
MSDMTTRPRSWIDGTPVTRFRLSDNRAWATEFDAADFEAFSREFVAALRRCGGRLVSLHSLDSGYWLNVGAVQMGVFADLRPAAQRLPECEPGRWECRGNGHDFLSVDADHPCVDLVWALACRQPYNGPAIAHEDCRAAARMARRDAAAGLAITHADMQAALEVVLRSGTLGDVLAAARSYFGLAGRFVAQGHTRGDVAGAMASLADAVIREAHSRVITHAGRRVREDELRSICNMATMEPER